MENEDLLGCLAGAQQRAAENGGQGLLFQGLGHGLGFPQTLRVQVKPGQPAIQDLLGVVDTAVAHECQLCQGAIIGLWHGITRYFRQQT